MPALLPPPMCTLPPLPSCRTILRSILSVVEFFVFFFGVMTICSDEKTGTNHYKTSTSRLLKLLAISGKTIAAASKMKQGKALSSASSPIFDKFAIDLLMEAFHLRVVSTIQYLQIPLSIQSPRAIQNLTIPSAACHKRSIKLQLHRL
jgi:hypothetical protein